MSRFRRGRAKTQDTPQDAPAVNAEDIPGEDSTEAEQADSYSESYSAAPTIESVPTMSTALVPFQPPPSPIVIDIPADQPPSEPPARRRSPYEIQWPLLFTVIILMTIAVGVLLRGTLPAAILTWWPLLIVVPGLLWLLIALVRRSGNGLLSSTAILGLGGSLLLATKTGTPVGSTLIGVMFITVGTGILLRGLLLGQQPIL